MWLYIVEFAGLLAAGLGRYGDGALVLCLRHSGTPEGQHRYPDTEVVLCTFRSVEVCWKSFEESKEDGVLMCSAFSRLCTHICKWSFRS